MLDGSSAKFRGRAIPRPAYATRGTLAPGHGHPTGVRPLHPEELVKLRGSSGFPGRCLRSTPKVLTVLKTGIMAVSNEFLHHELFDFLPGELPLSRRSLCLQLLLPIRWCFFQQFFALRTIKPGLAEQWILNLSERSLDGYLAPIAQHEFSH